MKAPETTPDAAPKAAPAASPAGGALSGWLSTALWIAPIVAAVGVSSYYAFALERAGSVAFWIVAGGPTVAFALVALVYAWREGVLGTWMRPVWGDPTRGILSAAVLVLCALAFVHLVAPVGSPRESWMARLYLQLGSPDVLREHAGALAGAVVSVAAAEEIVWRGLVTRVLEERVGSRRAWIVAAVLYALALVPSMGPLRDPVAGLNPLLPIAGLAAGLAWGAMTRHWGRLAPAILSHAAFDWCVVVMFRLWGPSV